MEFNLILSQMQILKGMVSIQLGARKQKISLQDSVVNQCKILARNSTMINVQLKK